MRKFTLDMGIKKLLHVIFLLMLLRYLQMFLYIKLLLFYTEYRMYKENLVKTNMRKSTLKKLIKDSCTKTAFSFDGKNL